MSTSYGISLPDLEALMASRRKTLRFPGALESAFQEQSNSYRKAVMRRVAWPLVLAYNAFLIADYVLMPKDFSLIAGLHLAVVTPLVLLACFLYARDVDRRVRATAAGAIPVMIVAQIMLVYALVPAPAVEHYHYLAVLVIIFMNVIPRPGYRVALAATVIAASIYLCVLMLGPASLAGKIVGAALMLTVCQLTLVGNWHMEQDLRYAFLAKLHEQLRREGAEDAANRDPLTGISNRRHLDAALASLWQRPDAEVSPVAMIMADIDRFKAYNDHYGHPAGDTCLKRVAGVISAELRNDRDLAVRLGGEEFLVVLPGTDIDTAVRIAERIRRSIEGLAIPHGGGSRGAIVTASFGAVVGDVGDCEIGALINKADEALYEAKGGGRNQVWPPLLSAADSRAAEPKDRNRQVA